MGEGKKKPGFADKTKVVDDCYIQFPLSSDVQTLKSGTGPGAGSTAETQTGNIDDRDAPFSDRFHRVAVYTSGNDPMGLRDATFGASRRSCIFGNNRPGVGQIYARF